MEHFYFNYLSVSYLSGTIFSFGLIIYLLSLRNKMAPTWLLCVYFIFTALLCAGYFVRASILDPTAAQICNYIIGLYTSFSNTLLLAFAFHFPRNLNPRESKIAIPISFLAGLFAYYKYIESTSGTALLYQFNTQLYQFKDTGSAPMMFAVLLLTFIYIVFLFIRKINLLRKEHNADLLSDLSAPGQTTGFFKNLISPVNRKVSAMRSYAVAVFLHLLFASSYGIYLAGKISFFDFQLILTSATSIQLFLYTIIYLNNAPQPTSFSAKLVGISLVSIILIMGFLSKLILSQNDQAYQNILDGDLNQTYQMLPYKVPEKLKEDGSYIVRHTSRKLDYKQAELLYGKRLESADGSYKYIIDKQEIDDLQTLPLIKDQTELQSEFAFQRLTSLAKPEGFYTAYLIQKDQDIYEIGFPYLRYRQRSHAVAWRLIVIMMAVILGLALILPFFFYGSLINPLNRLLEGVSTVNNGDYEVHVPVQVRDEIGYLSNSFNSMVRSIRDAHHKLEDYAENLENKVKHRTAELNNSLTEIKSLKQQQDGDYFLTSLLITPLSQNLADSRNVSIESLTRQKKQFKFRKWEAEIGGDLCISRNIHLQGRDYVVFLNADAMGKSIQGAGGALVIGAVFEALLKRTLNSTQTKSQSPERWLKNAFVELHNVFISFDGTMLISVSLGLIDDATGFMYHLNAEHPQIAIYRNQKASFIDLKYFHMKLGHSLPTAGVNIDTYQLMPGDVLFVGSDGRDDIRIVDQEGMEYIQEDETLFLRCIEEGRGLIDETYEAVRSKGELTDDLTLMRIAFQEDFSAIDTKLNPEQTNSLKLAREKFKEGQYNESIKLIKPVIEDMPGQPTPHKIYINNLLSLKNYDQVIQATEKYFNRFPGDDECLLILARANRQVGNFEGSLEYAERLRLRQPDNLRNLTILAECHHKLGNYERALQICDEILEMQPDHEKAMYLSSRISAG